MTSAVNPWEIESQPIVTYCPARHICLILFGRTVAPFVVVDVRAQPSWSVRQHPEGPLDQLSSQSVSALSIGNPHSLFHWLSRCRRVVAILRRLKLPHGDSS